MHKGYIIWAILLVATLCALFPINIISADDWWAQATQLISQMEYEINSRNDGSSNKYHAVNRAQNLRVNFHKDNVEIIERTAPAPSWVWTWQLESLGRKDVSPLNTRPSRAISKNRIEYNRYGILESYENTPEGIIQKLIIPSAPTGFGALSVVARCGSGFKCVQNAGTSPVDFQHGGKTVLRYSEIKATDYSGKQFSSGVAMSDDLMTISVNDSGAQYPLTVSLIIEGPSVGMLPKFADWAYESDKADAYLGFSVATAGDINGDDFSEVIIGAYNYQEDYPRQGKVFVFNGSDYGFSTTPSWTAKGQSSEYFGWSVATAGDLNGDMFSDVVIGAPGYKFNDVNYGKAYVYYGSRDGLGNEPSWSYVGQNPDGNFGKCVAPAGSVNGDSWSDILISSPGYQQGGETKGIVYLFYGSAFGIADTIGFMQGFKANAGFGMSAATAGDVNGDGYSDVIVGAPNDTNDSESNRGAAYLYLGSATLFSRYNPDWTVYGDLANALLGKSVSTAGDVNGDGYSDIIIGAPAWNFYYGAAYVYYGSATGPGDIPNWRGVGEEIGGQFGQCVAMAGDVNGDGYADVIVGQPSFNGAGQDRGASYVWLGSPEGLGGYELTKDADWSYAAGLDNAQFGISVATAGDVNGDGYSDVIIGAHGFSNGSSNEGLAVIFKGGPGTLSQEPGWDYYSQNQGDNLGFSVKSAGDVNGDGFADIIVGAPYYDSGYTDEGGVFVWYGSAQGPNQGLGFGVNWFARGGVEGGHLGYSVSSAGDINGDGYSDIIAGMPHRKNSQGDEGAAVVWYGAATGIPNSGETVGNSAVWTAEGDVKGAMLGYSVGWAGDVNGDGYSDIIIGASGYTNKYPEEGIACVWYGSKNGLGETGFYNNADWKQEGGAAIARLGISVGTAGDVNRDGFSDIIAGGYGFAAVWYGNLPGLPTTGPSWFRSGFTSGDAFGYSVGTAGDVNGDGYSDVIVGAPLSNGKGAAWVFAGAQNGLPQTAIWSDTGSTNSAFGFSVGTAGDVNGDGLADIIVGAPYYSSHPEKYYMGEVRVYYGNKNNPVSYNGGDWVKRNTVQNTKMGYSVASTGDINGDGYADIIVGSPMETRTQDNEGRISLYYGNGIRGVAIAPRQLQTSTKTPIAPLGMSDSPNQFDIEVTIHTPAGRGECAWIYEYKDLSTPFNGYWFLGKEIANTLLTGVKTSATVVSLKANTHYHWRIRMKHFLMMHPFNPPLGRWIQQPWNGWNESDLKTAPPTLTANDIVQYILTGENYQSEMDQNKDGFIDVSDVVRATK